MAGKNLRERLVGLGFVRVDGLRAYRRNNDGFSVILADESQKGCWLSKAGLTVVIDDDGEIWLAYGYRDDFQNELRRRAYVPFPAVETLSPRELLARVGNPEWMPKAENAG